MVKLAQENNMSFEREMNVAVRTMFDFAKAEATKNLLSAVRNKKITIDEARLPGIELIINTSIDDAFKKSARQITGVIKKFEV